jgi:hypothetical protein
VKRLLLALALLVGLNAPALAERVKMPAPLPPNQALLTCDIFTTCRQVFAPGPTLDKYELAGLVSRPFNYVAGQLILSNSLNQNEITLYTLVNGQLDSQNVNTAVGIGANQINTTCTGCTNTFGGAATYVFGNGLTVNSALFTSSFGNVISSNADANTPEIINGNSATQSAPLFIVNQSSGGVLEFQVASNGTGSLNGPLLFTNSANLNAGTSAAIYSTAAATSLIINVPAASPVGIQFRENNLTVANISGAGVAGGMTLAEQGQTTSGEIAPIYTQVGGASGTLVGPTQHHVYVIDSVAAVACNQDTVCNTHTDTFTNAALFTSATSYFCTSDGGSSNGGTPFIVTHVEPTAANTVSVTIANVGANLAGTTTYFVTYDCKGF